MRVPQEAVVETRSCVPQMPSTCSEVYCNQWVARTQDFSFVGTNRKVDIMLTKISRKLKLATTWGRTRVSCIPGKRPNH